MNAGGSPRSGSGCSRRRRGQDPAAWAYSGSRSVLRPFSGCGVLRAPTGTWYPLAQRPTLDRTTARGWAAGGHGPCHRPACPFCGSRDGVSRHHERRLASFERPRWTGSHPDGVGLVVPSPHPVLQGQGYCEHRVVHIGGKDPNFSRLVSAVELPLCTTPSGLNPAVAPPSAHDSRPP